jgi:methylglutaconyl-CoA hydratase
MADFQYLSVAVDSRGIATVALNSPQTRNAMSNDLMRELRRAAHDLAADAAVRGLILTGTGDIFSAGGDLKGMQRQASNSREGRIADATEFATTLKELDQLPKPLIGRINGSAFGGGLGLIAICDVAIGLTTATFRLSEVTLGLIPATISPYVVAKIGVPNARRTFLSARKLDGNAAVQIGLLDRAVATLEELDAAIEGEVRDLLACAPGAVANAKELIRFVSTHGLDENLPYSANALADAWETAELREGIDAFMNKRKPHWQA